MTKLSTVIALLIFLLIPGTTAAQDYSGLREVMQSLEDDPSLKHASWAVQIIDLESGESIGSRQADQSLVPASNMKLLTTAAALHYLGTDFSYETTLQYHGFIDSSGNLNGDIIIKGAGDPSLGSGNIEGSDDFNTLLNKFLDEIRNAGITYITGDVIGDASIYADNLPPSDWTFEDMGNYYGAFASGLSVSDNTFSISFNTGDSVDEPTKIISVSDSIPGVELYNYVITGSEQSGDKAYVHGAPYSNKYFIKGTLPASRNNFRIKATFPDPPLFFATKLKNQLLRNGIQIDGQARGISFQTEKYPNQRETIAVHKSPPLLEIVKYVNIESDNLYAEHLLKTIGLHVKGQGATQSGIEAIESFLKAKSIADDGFILADGSGLSRRNKLTANGIGRLLQMQFKAENFEEYLSSLPVAGQSGTMKHVAKNSTAAGRIYAKSGTLNGVRNYSGYIHSTSGKWYAFSFLANQFTCSSYTMSKKWVPLMIAIANL